MEYVFLFSGDVDSIMAPNLFALFNDDVIDLMNRPLIWRYKLKVVMPKEIKQGKDN